MNSKLADFLDDFAGPVRLALDALAACYAADVAAWKANGEPTDGTKNRLQHATATAVRLAAMDVGEACAAAGIDVARRAEILTTVEDLASLKSVMRAA